ncbi:2-dehydro-3-deoxy-6-phosphogalactonate aldolase [Actinotalea sp. K2]|uniref:2-dehydro-3-deoxy-6-phosphogalactonate aldolase n=1 Tax=Actinotalea sp. K2 TaxID=2939438 RepID=UPI0020181FEA|nr:2-dehydro-3-deoxy-6-phosphogalactonate aldolase [Actinotalea sp. K2]MCL3862132.1 2-dehydro-3-deoxy-6-phosphogalactonate aldolase [Actinotalea sp. K2]
MTTNDRWNLVAVLRGLQPQEAADVGRCLYEAGWRTLEVPLNRPGALTAISTLRRALPLSEVAIGAGTVLTPEDVLTARDAGAEFVVSPNVEPTVIQQASASGLASCPGVATPSEALAAIGAGADVLKVFPAGQVGQSGLRAWVDVLPPGTRLLPVGGVTPGSLATWLRAGATGFGVGRALFRPGITGADLRSRAREFHDAWTAAHAELGSAS